MISRVDDDELWGLIAMIGPDPEDGDYHRAIGKLAARPVEDIYAFADRLAELLYALDTEAHAKAARARGDWFLYVRCAAVLAGPVVYGAVLAEPSRLRRFAKREAELLLSVPSEAYEHTTGMPWTHETPLSYESGSNADGWSGAGPNACLPLPLRVLAAVIRPFYRPRPGQPDL
jgi:hypothetical protein